MRSGFVYYPITYVYVKEKHQKHRRIKQARSPSTRPKYLSFQSLPSRWQNRGVFASQELVLPFPWRFVFLVSLSVFPEEDLVGCSVPRGARCGVVASRH